jgi:serine/threonine protein kinase
MQQSRNMEPDIGERLGSYRLEARLGEGAMGVVYRAVREPDGAIVALKVLRDELANDEVFRRRFNHEAKAATEVEHRNLVPVLDAGESDGRFYLASRYVAGRSLADRLDADGPLTLPELLRLIAEVGRGLQALHERGLVHRDVKPSNVLLDADGTAALGDFGLAKGRAYTVLTRPGQILGTLDYLAPELIRGAPAGPASDIYALGCVAFECLAGAPPFAGRSVLQVGVAHLQQEPPDPAAGRSDVPSAVSWAIRRTMAKEPDGRPQTALAFSHMLQIAAGAHRP